MLATDEYETPRWAMLGLGTGFVLLAIVGILTVLIPELEDEPTESDEPSIAGQVEAHAAQHDSEG
jgi:hypothetical protein